MTAPTARSERGWLLVAWLGLLSGLVATWVFADDALSAFLLPLPPAMMTVAGTVIVRRTDVPRIGGLLLVSGTWVGWYGALFAGLPATGSGALEAGLAVASAAVYPLFLIIVMFPRAVPVPLRGSSSSCQASSAAPSPARSACPRTWSAWSAR